MRERATNDLEQTADLASRSAEEVLEDHLRLRRDGDLDSDIERNYADDVVVLTARGVVRGHDGVREYADLLYRAVAESQQYDYDTVVADDRVALLEWSVTTNGSAIRDGVDSYLIEDGQIKVQTIHYSVVSTDLSVFAGDSR